MYEDFGRPETSKRDGFFNQQNASTVPVSSSLSASCGQYARVHLFVVVMLIVPLIIDSIRNEESILKGSAREFPQLRPVASILGHVGKVGSLRGRTAIGLITGAITAAVVGGLELGARVALPEVIE